AAVDDQVLVRPGRHGLSRRCGLRYLMRSSSRSRTETDGVSSVSADGSSSTATNASSRTCGGRRHPVTYSLARRRRRLGRRIACVDAVVVVDATRDRCGQGSVDCRLGSNVEAARRAPLSVDVEMDHDVASRPAVFVKITVAMATTLDVTGSHELVWY